jgi:hypothetical protein
MSGPDFPPIELDRYDVHVSDQPTPEERITQYLANGGLFNPELMANEATRDLLRDCRAELETLRAALHSIAANTCCERCQEAALVAKAALGSAP